MASPERVLVATVLLAIGAACGISAVGQRSEVEPPDDPDAGSSSSSGGSSSASGSSSGGIVDGGPDGALPDATADAPADGPLGCPAVCNGGCDGGCIINGGQTPTCPPGVARCEVNCTQQNDCDTVTCGDALTCRVTCQGNSVCNSDTINCGTSICQIRCIGQDACNSTTFDTDNAASLCIHCDGSPACNSVTCTSVLGCTKQFLGSGNQVGGCVMCANGLCP